ncbi:hypothetical protein K7X08_013736 [Anisodus acutangulus]|uniref:Glycosyltransferase n=1 Tax=Anisodus acutangulus TaxID=402998 RepID=A0A9Q1R447_9SOLA|nr:hypothetical protein K7X08_013736 [Anisodus acutangulus]
MEALIETHDQSGQRSRIAAIVIGVVVGCAFAFFYPYGFFSPDPPAQSFSLPKNNVLVESWSYESTEWMNMLRSYIRRLSEKNAELQKQLGEPKKAAPFGKVKSTRTKLTVMSDESVNPRLAKILAEVAVEKEIIVVLANSNVKSMLEIWFTSIKSVGIPNYLVVALDDAILDFCKENEVNVYKRDPDENVDFISKTGKNQAVSGLKFRILREFLQLGYSILLSDVDIVYLQNPFDHLHQDSDVEAMSDGHDNKTSYGYNDVSDEPDMSWGQYAHTMRIWAYNSGFFYIRPTIPAIELLDRVAGRLAREPNLWDQAVFNEELAFPSRPGYIGLYASRRTMDLYLFMNSKVLFKTARKDSNLKKVKPVVVHINYHPDKFYRMEEVVEYYVNGKQDALYAFPDGSDW